MRAIAFWCIPAVAILGCNQTAEKPPEVKPEVQKEESSVNERATAACKRAEQFRREEQYQKAVAEYSEAIRLSPNFIRAFIGRASVWVTMNEDDKALQDCAEAIRLEPNDYLPYYLRGQIWLGKKEFDQAIK